MIRLEQPGDIESIRNVIKAAFPTSTEADLVDSLRCGGNLSISLVAEKDAQIVGHLGFSPVKITGQGTAQRIVGLGLAPVSVWPTNQRQGIGTQLIRAGLNACRSASIDYVVVLGEPDYYQRFGFTPASNRGLQNEYGVDAEFMALELTDACLRNSIGTAQYSHEFQSLPE